MAPGGKKTAAQSNSMRGIAGEATTAAEAPDLCSLQFECISEGFVACAWAVPMSLATIHFRSAMFSGIPLTV